MKKKALLVGSSFSAAPFLFKLKKRGMHVSVCGNALCDPCHQYADASHFIDYSDKDALLKLVRENSFDVIVPTCNDYSYMSCAWVAEQCGFAGFDSRDVATILHNKIAFRRFTEGNGFPVPSSLRLGPEQDPDFNSVRYPLLVKPVDSFSGRGVSKVWNRQSLEEGLAAARTVSRTGEAVVEQFVEGSLHSHSAFVKDRKIVFNIFADEYCTVYPYQVNCSNHPSGLPAAMRDAVRKEMERMVNLLDLNDGLLHTQFIVQGDDFWIIECMRRCPGDLYGSMIDQSLGIDYVDLVLQLLLGEPFAVDNTFPFERFIGRHTISAETQCVPFTFSNSIPATEVRIAPLKLCGERLNPAPYDKLAILFAAFESRNQMLELVPKLDTMISVQPILGSMEQC